MTRAELEALEEISFGYDCPCWNLEYQSPSPDDDCAYIHLQIIAESLFERKAAEAESVLA